MSLTRTLRTARLSATTAPVIRQFSSSPLNRSSPSPAPAGNELDWPTYLALRRKNRTYNLLASIPTTLLGAQIGLSQFASLEMEPTDTIMGLEPVYALGAATLGCIGLGWLCGPILGTQVYKLTHRKLARAMEAKEKDFYEHIKRKRASPTLQSAQNPTPDYYGEKISSLKGYRQWLRDQSAYTRKAQFGTGSDAAL